MTFLRRLGCGLMVAVVLGLALSASSCGGGGDGSSPDLVLLGFNLPNIAGVALNQPLIFTFSTSIDLSSVTPDTLRTVGAQGPFFETIVADGNLLALIPRGPNFDDYSDVGLAPATSYSVSMSVFPAASTIRSIAGKPLLEAESFTFTTVPSILFIEPRRPIRHGLAPSAGGRSDDEGCLQNAQNALFKTCTPPVVEPPGVDNLPPQPKCLETNPSWCNVQAGSCPGARLLCLVNEGKPRILVRDDGVPPGPAENSTIPSHGQLNVGTPSAVRPGFIDMPAIRIRANEFFDPLTVTPLPTSGLGVNVQLWRVGDTDRNPLPAGPEQVRTNTPVTVQSTNSAEIILVSAQSVLQGTYLVNLKPSLKDLPGNTLHPDTGEPNAVATGFGAIEASIAGKVPAGFRIYFVTLELPNAPQAFSENYGNNLNEWGDLQSGATEPGVFTQSNPAPVNDPNQVIPGVTLPSPSFTLVNTLLACGQSTTANWNGGFRFLNLSGVDTMVDAGDDPADRLRAVWQPYLGDGQDGVLDTAFGIPSLDTSTGSANGDGVYEFESVHIRAGHTVVVSGANPLLILCRGDFIVDGTLDLSAQDGGPGFDTDGTSFYLSDDVPPVPFAVYGSGGAGGPGGSAGGNGADPFAIANSGGVGVPSVRGRTPEFRGNTPEDFKVVSGVGAGGGFGGDDSNFGGGGGGYGADGGNGEDPFGDPASNKGFAYGDANFAPLLTDFQPDRAYMPNCAVMGGAGGGGGGAEDDSSSGETGDNILQNNDDAGGGGGGGGGGLMVFAGGVVTVSAGGFILADGGDGGDTLDFANTRQLPGADGQPGGGDDKFGGAIVGAEPSGDGGPGGGGSGGGIVLFSKGNLTVNGTLSTAGGTGGESFFFTSGGDGAGGRVHLSAFPGSTISVGGSVVAATSTQSIWNPTIDLASVGQSNWFDLVTPTADFNPDTSLPPDGVGDSPPFFSGNFSNPNSTTDLNDPLPLGYGLVKGTDFDAVLEMQGADNLIFPPGGGAPATTAGLTQWVDVLANGTNINLLDTKRFVRYRWRFFVRNGYPGLGPSAVPMPAIFDVTIPFKR